MDIMETKEFIKFYNKKRLQNKGCWYMYNGFVNGKMLKIACCNTQVRSLHIDGKDMGTAYFKTVRDWKNYLENKLEKTSEEL